MTRPLIAVVTGANRGLGLAICTSLVQRIQSAGLVLYVASRSGDAIQLPITPKARSLHFDVRPAQLSLEKDSDIDALRDKIVSEHGSCDVLINNAGVYHYRENITPAERKQTFDVNFRGTLKMCQAFIPIMSNAGRIVNVSSQAGQLKYFDKKLRSRFTDKHLTLQDLEDLILEYNNAADRQVEAKLGWPSMTYSVSKAALNAATRILAEENSNLVINCCCPGWVQTDLGGQAGSPPKSPMDGAKIPTRLAIGDLGGVTGRYWANDDVSSAGEGKVQAW